MLANKTRFVHLLAIMALASFVFLNIGLFPLSSSSSTNKMLVSARQKSDILFLKGKFILKDKKGSIVISDDKKPCECPHYYR